MMRWCSSISWTIFADGLRSIALPLATILSLVQVNFPGNEKADPGRWCRPDFRSGTGTEWIGDYRKRDRARIRLAHGLGRDV